MNLRSRITTILTLSILVLLTPNFATCFVSHRKNVTISGTAERYCDVLYYVNGTSVAVSGVSNEGTYEKELILPEGENRIRVTARNRAGESTMSNEVVVTVDTSIPLPPSRVEAQVRAGGVVRTIWPSSTDSTIKGYNVYRSSWSVPENVANDVARRGTLFTKVNASTVTATSYDDVTPLDARWYYRITTVDRADNESDMSPETSAVSDATEPKALQIAYVPRGRYDEETGRMAAGIVDVAVSVNEALQAAPFLSLTPDGGTPVTIELSPLPLTSLTTYHLSITTETAAAYRGTFIISPTMPTGTAYAVFSGRDLAGNRGTNIEHGASCTIDTHGPEVVALHVDPSSPVQNTSTAPATITVTIGLDDVAITTPTLSYILSSAPNTEVRISSLTRISPDQYLSWPKISNGQEMMSKVEGSVQLC